MLIDRCSAHFTLDELTVTSTGLDNTPDVAAVGRLIVLATEVLEPWRATVGPLRITSGFRSQATNEAVGGSKTSDHMLGRAADVQPVSCALAAAWSELLRIRFDLPLDQALIYVRPRGFGWIHVSWRIEPRRQVLVQPHGHPGIYVPYSEWTQPVVSG